MINGVSGLINSTFIMSFDIAFGGHDCPGPGCENVNCGQMKLSKDDVRQPILKGSKSVEKGSFITYCESTDVEENQKYFVTFKDLVNTVTVTIAKDYTKPKIRIYSQIPTPQNFELSEFFAEGYFNIEKVNIEPAKKTVQGDTLMQKLQAEPHLSIEKLFFKKIGEPLITQSVIKSSFGDIVTIKPLLEVDI